MLPMIVTDCLVLLVMTSMWGMTCHGYIVVDAGENEGENAGENEDDMWPVLCPPNTFYSKTQDQCLACSQCPANKIIITQCHGLHDTKCGPFYNFADLISPETSLPENDTVSNDGSSDPVSHRTHHDPKPGVPHMDSSKSTFKLTDSEWRFVTICLFVSLSLAAAVISLLVVYLFRRKDTSEKRLLCEYSPPVGDV